MFGSEQVHTITLDVDVDPGGDKDYHLWRAPRAATVQRLTAVTDTAHGAGTAYALALENWGTAGTSAEGTITTSALGGTASPFSAATPATTATMSEPYMDAGDWLVLALDEQGSGWQSGEVLRVQVDVVIGQSAVNS